MHTLPIRLPCIRPIRQFGHPAIWPATHPANLARHAPGPFGQPSIRPICPHNHPVHPAHSACRPPGTFSPLPTLKGWPSLPHVIGPLCPNGIISEVRGVSPCERSEQVLMFERGVGGRAVGFGWWEGGRVWQEGGMDWRQGRRVWQEGCCVWQEGGRVWWEVCRVGVGRG